MALFNWSDRYSFGVSSMDEHHRKIFDIANQIHDAMKAGKSKELADEFVKRLIEYTEYHFAEEEKLMAEINYDDLPLQRRAHTIFISQLKDFQEQIEQGDTILLSVELSQTVVDWLIEHIAKMDKRYEDSMKRHGIK